MNKDNIITILKILVAVLSAILSVLGASALCSCTGSHIIDGVGKTTIVTVDTTTVVHQGILKTK